MPHESNNPLPPGRIDIHSHLIPDVDDGCATIDESIACIRAQQSAGYVGSICTPHIWVDLFPRNTMPNIRDWTAALQHALREQGIDYRLWPGGELRLFDGILHWLEEHEVPTLAESRYVLTDFWEPNWPWWVDAAMDRLLERGYTPILAHPERIAVENLDAHLDALAARGVLMQGNFRPFTGGDGALAGELVRRFAHAGRYDLLALDMHAPDTLASRLDGAQIAERELGADYVTERTEHAPRHLIFQESTRRSPRGDGK